MLPTGSELLESGAVQPATVNANKRRATCNNVAVVFPAWFYCQMYSTNSTRVSVVDPARSRSASQAAALRQAECFYSTTKTIYRRVKRGLF